MIADWAGYVSLAFTVGSIGFWCFLNFRIWRSYKRAMIAHEQFMRAAARAQRIVDAIEAGDQHAIDSYHDSIHRLMAVPTVKH